MKLCNSLFSLFLIVPCLAFSMAATAQPEEEPRFGMVIHGGAGTILRSNMTPEAEQAYRAKLTEALQAGYTVLNDGGSSLDAIVATIIVMEDSPLFNSGKGAVFTSEGTVELDASIMDGRTRNAGAVAGIKHIKNPIKLARLVMEDSPHVMMVGAGAETFAKEHNLEMVENEYFHTDRRREALEAVQARERARSSTGDARQPAMEEYKYGTVGAVALDKMGNLAAATSTGGMTNKRFGRVGDSPIIGAGTYADNETCGVSATGHGEFFIRGVIAYDICAIMRYTGLSLTEAANAVIHGKLTDMGGAGGVIAMDREGNVAMPFNTPGMYRGTIDKEGNVQIGIFGN